MVSEKKDETSAQNAVADGADISLKPAGTFVSKKNRKSIFGDDPFYKKPKVKKTLLGVLIVVVLVVLALVFYKPPYYKTTSVTNGGYTYSFKFARDAVIKNISTVSQPVGYNLTKTNKIGVTVYKSNILADCHKEYSFLTLYFTSSIQGENYSTCASPQKTDLITTFKYDGVWQQMEIYSVNQKTPIDLTTAQTVVSSIKVVKAD